MIKKIITLLIVFLVGTSYGPPNCNIYKSDENCYKACRKAEKAISYDQGVRKSQEYFDESIALCPNFDNSYYEKAVPYAKRGLIKEWKQMIDKAVEINPREHLLTRGWYHFFFMNNYEAAIKDIDAAGLIIKGDIGYTGDGVYHLNILKAVCYKKLGNNEKAIDIIENQLALEDHHFGLYDYLHLGVLYLERKDYNKAIESLNKQESFSDVSEIYYYKALVLKGLKKLDEYKLNLEKAKEYYLKEKTMSNPYRQMIDEIYLVDIENEMALTSN